MVKTHITGAIYVSLFTSVLLMSGCSEATNVYEIGNNKFTISATGDGYVTANKVRELVLQKANEHCAKRGKTLNLIDERLERTRMKIDTTITLDFSCY